MVEMTRRERLTAILEGRVPDRPAVKVWGVSSPDGACVHPDFEPVRDLALEKTDLFAGGGSPFALYCGRHTSQLVETREEATESPDWVHDITVYHTPEGDLRGVFRRSTRKRPGYQMEYLLKEPDDIRRLLSMPYEPHPFDAEGYRRADEEVGDAGITMFGLDHAMYGLQRLIGSENFALWSVEAEDRIMEAMQVFAGRLADHARAAIEAGIRGIYGWVGPELCIPPLMSPSAFDRYVTDLDKPLIDLIHDAGGRVWVHCHGKMGPVLERFVNMGVDVLNPVEPPPMGDVTLTEAFEVAGEKMGLEGGIQTHDLMTAPADELYAKIHAAVDAGRGRRMILCPSSGYQESVVPSASEIENWLLYINEGVRYASCVDDTSGGQ